MELTSFSQETKSIHVTVVADLSQLLSYTEAIVLFHLLLQNRTLTVHKLVSQELWSETNLKCGRQEGRTDAMYVASVDLDADVAIVHLEEVKRTLRGADVALA